MRGREVEPARSSAPQQQAGGIAVADDEAGVRSAAIEGISCAYCAFGVSGGVGAAPVGAAFFFFGAWSAGCWASAPVQCHPSVLRRNNLLLIAR
jgi:hypothetical protein